MKNLFIKKYTLLFLAVCLSLPFSAVEANAQTTRQIRLAKNSNAATVSGKIIGGKQVIYLITARKGQTLEFDIADRRENNDVVAEVFAPGGKSLTGEDFGKEWRGKLPQNGVYKISVGTIESENAEFTMRVAIK